MRIASCHGNCLCPINVCAVFKSTPAIMSLEQNVLPEIVPSKVWDFCYPQSPSRTTFGNHSGPFRTLTGILDHRVGGERIATSNAFRQVLFIGISRLLPFLVSSRRIRFLLNETSGHSSEYCSPFRIPVFSAISNSSMWSGQRLLITARTIVFFVI